VGAAWAENDDGGAPQGARPGLAKNLEIWVADTGTGIPAEDHDRIFERFGKGTNSAGTEGSGLGLSIVKAIAEAHGGTVRLESEVGKGSRFVLVIPSGGGDSTGEASSGEPNSTAAEVVQLHVRGPSSGVEILTQAGGTP
jgi:signal transduction histidine kinase